MHKLLLILILNVFITGTTFSQVFISKAIEGSILLGPANVNHHKEATTDHYFSLIQDFKTQLNRQEMMVKGDAKLLEAKKRLNKKNQKLLKDLKFEEAKIAAEKELVNKLIGDWMATIKNNKTLLALSRLSDDVCYEITTDKGTFQKDQLEIYRTDPKDIKYEAFIPISSFSQYTTERGQWVRKKKSPNCFHKILMIAMSLVMSRSR